MQINVQSVPALVSLVMMVILAIVSWSDRREKLNVALALFTSLLTLVSLFGFLGLASDDPPRGRLWFRLMILLLTPSYWAGFYYVLVLTGFIKRLDERVLGLRLRHLLAGIILFTGAVQLLAQTTTTIIDFNAPRLEQLFEPRMTWFSAALVPVGVYMMAAFLVVMIRAWRESEPGTAHRVFLLLNILGVGEIFIAGALIAKVMAFAGFDARPWVFISYTIASVIFYVAMVRYQRAQIRSQVDEISELNRSLERKVEERTHHLREAQARLAQAEKMASLGRLAAGVAHEVNNPLGALTSSNETSGRWRARLAEAVAALPASEEGGANEVIARALRQLEQGEEVIARGAERVAETIDRLRAFARLDQAELQVVRLRDCVEDTLALEPALQGDAVTVHREYDDALPRVACYPAQLNLVLQNLIANAMDAMDGMEGGGELWVRTAADGDRAMIQVRDSGSGMAEEMLARVFDPGFTTKSRGVGTGLGLAICYQVMRDHGGSIDIKSQPGKGTTVTARLPLQAKGA